MANVVFDQQSAERIAKAVKYVEGLQSDEPPVDGDEDLTGGRTVIRGTFNDIWYKNAVKDVHFIADNGDSGTKAEVVNYFAEVGEDGATSACCIIQAGSEWILIAAECS